MVCGAEVAEGLAGVAQADLRADLPHDFADVFFMAGMILVFMAGGAALHRCNMQQRPLSAFIFTLFKLKFACHANQNAVILYAANS